MSVSEELRQALPSLICDGDEPIFNEPWEARAFAIAVSLNEGGHFTWGEWAEIFGSAIAQNTKQGDPLSYYQVWANSLEDIMLQKQVVGHEDLTLRKTEWEAACLRTPHGEPITL